MSTHLSKQVLGQAVRQARAIYQDIENNPSIRSIPGGYWRIVQNSFTDIICAPSL